MVTLKMASNTYSTSKKWKEELRRFHPNNPEPCKHLPTYRHVVGIDVVICWMGLDWKFDTRNIICGIKRKKVLIRSKCLRRVAYKREKGLQNVNTGLCHTFTACRLAFHTHLILTVTLHDCGTEKSRDHPAEPASDSQGENPGSLATTGPQLSTTPRHLLRRNKPTVSILGCEPCQGITYSSRVSYKLLCPFYRSGNWGSRRLSNFPQHLYPVNGSQNSNLVPFPPWEGRYPG